MGRRARLGAILALLALVTGAALAAAQTPRVGQAAADISAGRWINSEPQTIVGLRGRVVAIDFWTFG